MNNICKRVCAIFLIVMFLFTFIGNFSFAATLSDVANILKQEPNLKSWIEQMTYDVSVVAEDSNKIVCKINMGGMSTYENVFNFDDTTCKIVLKSKSDEMGLKLAQDMWFAIWDSTSVNSGSATAITNNETGEQITEEQARDELWKWAYDKIEEDTLNTAAIDFAEVNETYVVTMSTAIFKLNNSNSTSTNTEITSTAPTATSTSVGTNVTKVPNAGINVGVINFLKTVISVAIVLIIIFTIYNIGESFKRR